MIKLGQQAGFVQEPVKAPGVHLGISLRNDVHVRPGVAHGSTVREELLDGYPLQIAVLGQVGNPETAGAEFRLYYIPIIEDVSFGKAIALRGALGRRADDGLVL
jgi:hypothetical protein